MPTSSRTRRGLQSWLSATATPVFLLDARRVVLFFNQGCERLTGCAAADVIGKRCEYVTEAEPERPESVTGRLCPPLEVFEGRACCAPADFPRAAGDLFGATIHFFPLDESGAGSMRVLGVITPRGVPACVPATPAAELHAVLAAVQSDLRRMYGADRLIARSPAMLRVMQQVRVAHGCRASVHFTGGQGTGREHLARVIHSQGADRTRTFVPLDCRRLPPFELKRALRRALIHEPGDDGDSPGGLPGTLFLRNVAHLPRDLQELVVEACAGSDAVRLMSSSTGPLIDALEADELIPGFYYRVTELTIEVPLLRQRREDLPLLAQQLLEQHNRGDERQVGGFTQEVLEQFARYNWPGNVAELAAVVAEARAAAAGALITPQDLPFRFRTGIDAQAIGPAVEARPIDLEAALAEVEREHILGALRQAKNNKSQAAALLGLTRPKLYRRMEVLGMVESGIEGERPGLE
jgi:transcriptional regulator with PAS, ATPase and Fis domain